MSSQQGKRSLRLVLMGDTHALHRECDVPPGDILIHCGDATIFGKTPASIRDFNAWLGSLPHLHKIFVPGNHEIFLEEDLCRRSLIRNAKVLINESIEVEGLRIWGSPVTPLYGGAFGMSSSEHRKELYSKIPDDTDVVVTHGPPYGLLDTAPESGIHSGCRELLDALERVRPKLHVFGHLHGAYGSCQTESTVFVNCALLGVNGGLDRPPIVLNIKQN